MAAQVKVHERRLQQPGLNAGPVCDESAAEGGVYTQIRYYVIFTFLSI